MNIESGYNISKENDGLELIRQYPIIEKFYGSRIKQIFETDCEEQLKGADFQLENGMYIDLKSELGQWKPGKYYDSIVLSVERDQSCRYGQPDYNKCIWRDCLLSKITNSWFIPVQVSAYFILFYSINRDQALYIKNNYKVFQGLKQGKWQRYVIIPLVKWDPELNRFINNPDITKAPFFLDLRKNELVPIRTLNKGSLIYDKQ